MARTQRDLQAALRTLAPKAWLRRPPEHQMTYPCFVYRPSRSRLLWADDKAYLRFPCWNVIYITQEANSDIEARMLETFEYCSMDREYESDGLYHYSFTLYY